jgi:hypothetical protein
LNVDDCGLEEQSKERQFKLKKNLKLKSEKFSKPEKIVKFDFL